MKRKTKATWSVISVVVVLAWLWPEEDRSPAPDERLVAHLEATCAIAKNNVTTPARGVEALFSYLGENSPAMMKEFGELLVLIERIPDDAQHDERARQAARRIQGTARRCEAHWERFLLAVERDPKARDKFERGVERLGRTLEILFGGSAGALPDWAMPEPRS